eukprot:CAMPEP_0184486714 /NCGR_PEP_ID=MMETSP0113_2-20130426/8389_1 /TAXON_ID=91329 /ORGANISM="Norrisiella sphaerica, Strain BC52" /LENGTH=103 /DNA_ID=CAMNT_0026868721 /DNA_START=18 /DNA_END=329 /DNA_ORIENTATION=+
MDLDPTVIATLVATNVATAAVVYLTCGGSGSGKCNTSIKLSEKKVVDVVKVDDLQSKASAAGNKTVAYCRCWKSKKFPLCDGSHNKHNATTGDNAGPLCFKAE